MVKVISVEAKKKYYLVCTNKEDYKVEEDIIVKYNIFNNTEFSDLEFDKILNEANIVSAYNKVLRYLSFGPRSKNELAFYLKERGINNIQEVLERLKKDGYINDLEVAKKLLDHYKEQHKGPKYISLKMKEKMIDEEIIKQVIANYSKDEAYENALKVLEKIAPTLSKYPIKKQKEKLFSSLLSKGYFFDVCAKAIEVMNLEDDSMELMLKDLEKIKTKAEKLNLNQREKETYVIEHLLAKGYEYSKIKDAL